MTAPAGDGLPQDDTYDRLLRLLPAQFDGVCLRVGAPTWYLRAASQGQQVIDLLAWARQDPGRTGALRAALTLAEASRTPPEYALLYARLCALLDGQFTEVLLKLGVPPAFLSADAAPRSTRASEVLRWVQQQELTHLPTLRAALDTAEAAVRSARWRRWARFAGGALGAALLVVGGGVAAIRAGRESREATFLLPPAPRRLQVDVDVTRPLFGARCKGARLFLCVTDGGMNAFRRNTMWPSYLVKSPGVARRAQFTDDQVNQIGARGQLESSERDPGRVQCRSHPMTDANVSEQPGRRRRLWRILIDVRYPPGRRPEADFDLRWSCDDGEETLVPASASR